MSYIIDFYISCPMCLPEGSPKLHAEIRLAQGPGQAPAFSYPSEIDFYNDPRSVHGVFRATIQKPIRPR